ncbi:hypothetical protein KVR01_012760 [Diaporthe batatas]|uniref:uncharacterized protein n=1 Tax=Diaporthe batatas TaxID=748121 RepID=UPI001D0458DA|nr:uncharacterized protein KVR01_012760 [Diaporthe batatas]KAG8157376.1 hypothetical protein KVR01_012760 [Diaporthe batatas]
MGHVQPIYLWWCCYCEHGGMNASTTPACVNCGVVRCGGCTVEVYKLRGGGGGSRRRATKLASAKERIRVPVAAGASTANSRQLESSSHTSATPTTSGAAKSREDANHPGVLEARNQAREAEADTVSNEDPPAEQVSGSSGERGVPQSWDLMRDLLDVKGKATYQEQTPATIKTDVSDSASVVSTFSSATTLVDPGAVAAFAESLTKFQSLGYLWPQLVERCDTKQTFIHAAKGLLKRYANDLTLVGGEGKSMSDKSNNKLRLTAVKFIRKSRTHIARKIWEAQAEEGVKPGEIGPVGHHLHTEIPSMELDEDDFDDVLFDTIEEILFDQGPIFSLQANIKVLISRWNPMETSTIYRFSSSINTSVKNTISSLREPLVSPGDVRLRYTCRCGRKLYDDFNEAQMQSGALTNLGNLLASYFGGHPVTIEPGDFEESNTPDTSRGSRNMASRMNLWEYFLNRRQRDPRLPWTRQNAGDTELRICSRTTANRQDNHTRVLLCLPFMRWAKKLYQIDTCNVRSDQSFFLSLREQYSLACRSRRWSSLTRPRRVVSMEFVKFEVYKNELIDVHDCPSVPDRDDQDQAKMNYTYNPLPAELNPPIGTNLLMHLYQNPTHADVEPFMYRKIPKKLGDRLAACPDKGSAVGWGVRFTEGVDWSVLFCYGCVGFLFALVFAMAWSIARGDIQSGFAVGSFMVAFVIFCLGIAQTEVQLGI